MRAGLAVDMAGTADMAAVRWEEVVVVTGAIRNKNARMARKSSIRISKETGGRTVRSLEETADRT